MRPGAEPMKRKEYEKALRALQVELCALPDWVKAKGLRVIVVFEGRDAAEQMAPGDVVLLESGDKVPADRRLTGVKNLRTEEAALTGESVPADKSTEPVSAKATVGDRACMAFSGAMVVSGRATGVVVATGSETELGRINQMLAGVSALETPLLKQIKKFGYAITAVIGVVSVVVETEKLIIRSRPALRRLVTAVEARAQSARPEAAAG